MSAATYACVRVCVSEGWRCGGWKDGRSSLLEDANAERDSNYCGRLTLSDPRVSSS